MKKALVIFGVIAVAILLVIFGCSNDEENNGNNNNPTLTQYFPVSGITHWHYAGTFLDYMSRTFPIDWTFYVMDSTDGNKYFKIEYQPPVPPKHSQISKYLTDYYHTYPIYFANGDVQIGGQYLIDYDHAQNGETYNGCYTYDRQTQSMGGYPITPTILLAYTIGATNYEDVLQLSTSSYAYHSFSGSDVTVSTTEWYAANVGLIKIYNNEYTESEFGPYTEILSIERDSCW